MQVSPIHYSATVIALSATFPQDSVRSCRKLNVDIRTLTISINQRRVVAKLVPRRRDIKKIKLKKKKKMISREKRRGSRCVAIGGGFLSGLIFRGLTDVATILERSNRRRGSPKSAADSAAVRARFELSLSSAASRGSTT